MYIIVAGGGKVGFYLARELIAGGHEVLLIEKSGPRCEIIAAELGNVAAVKEVLTARRMIKTAENVHQRRLARSRRARRGDELSLLDVERDTTQGVHLHFADGVGLGQIPDGNDRHYPPPRPRPPPGKPCRPPPNPGNALPPAGATG